MIDLPALEALAVRSPTRDRVIAEGFRSVCASSDLHLYGYQIRHWLRLKDGAELVEFHPRGSHFTEDGAPVALPDLPRVVVGCYADQAAVHQALGLNLVPPGEPWQDYGGPGLFDAILFAEPQQ